ncbi:GH25 family lysozyme, partial [Ralstonia pseudosolanacearum]|uniref:GH25 family lysozyme n=1 Tax=Ralstonia pseudosolanacearum TaxID=1310165 RepID=UPI003D16B54B
SIWAQVVNIETGILPMIYISASETKKLHATAALGCGLWVAKWGPKPTNKQIEPWLFWAIWQYTNSAIFSGVRCDMDIFNGERDQLLKYCK